MQIDERKYFLLWEKASRDTIDVKRVYIDLADDLAAGVLLSQIIFWFLPNPQGRPKTRVQRQGEAWLAKRRTDWHDECRLSPRQYDRAARILEDKGLIITRTWHFAGSPCIHVRPCWDRLISAIADAYGRQPDDPPEAPAEAETGKNSPSHESVNNPGVDNFVDNLPDISVTDLPNSRVRKMHLTDALIAYTENTNRDTPLGTAPGADSTGEIKEALQYLEEELRTCTNPAAEIRRGVQTLFGKNPSYKVCGNAWRVALKVGGTKKEAARRLCNCLATVAGDTPGVELYDGLNRQLPAGRQEGPGQPEGQAEAGRIFQTFEAARNYYDYNRPDPQVTMDKMFKPVFPDGRPWDKQEAKPGQKPAWQLAPKYDNG